MSETRHWRITHAVGAPCGAVDHDDDVLTDPEESGDVNCKACLDISPPRLIVGSGHAAEVSCPACGSDNILFREGGIEYGYVRGVSYDGSTLRIKLTDHEGGDLRFWCGDCDQTVSTEGWDYDYV